MNGRILILYYSMTGNTRRIVVELRDALGASSTDVEEVLEARPRRGPFGALRAILDSAFLREPKVRPPVRRLEDYALVLLGTPIWGDRLAGPMRTVARALGTRARHVAFFCTAGGSNGARAFQELEQLCRRTPVSTMALTAQQLDSAAHAELLRAFVGQLRHVATPAAVHEPA